MGVCKSYYQPLIYQTLVKPFSIVLFTTVFADARAIWIVDTGFKLKGYASAKL